MEVHLSCRKSKWVREATEERSIGTDGVPEEIREAGGIWEDKEVLVDGNLVTSRLPMDLPAFMREVMRMVKLVGK